MIAAWIAGFLPLAIWLTMMAARGQFWLMRERDDTHEPAEPAQWPSVTAVVPARDEADVIARSIGSLLAQDYPGPFRVILVDDQSTDGTAAVARSLDTSGKLTVLDGAARPPGWTGKLWAVKQGIDRATADSAPNYVWLTDADISHAPDNLRKLIARGEAGGFVLTSLMAELNCTTFAERLLIPAFVFFFAMLYPFGLVSRKGGPPAAAGGCMLVKRTALEAAGGIESIRGEIIDDCALARRMRTQGPIWLGLTHRALSLRPYNRIADVRKMVSRSAYAQLGYSPLMLAGTLFGMALVFIAPPCTALFASGRPQLAGALAWILLAVAFQPMLRFYRRSPLWGVALPVIAGFYTAFTLDSAIQVWRGRGGQWKGRAQAMTGA